MAKTNGKITKLDKGSNNFLVNAATSSALPTTVSNTGVAANSNGRKVILAGTVVGGSKKYLEDTSAVLTVLLPAASANAQGITAFDVDVTDGDEVVSVIYEGSVLENLIPTVDAAFKTALPKITFIKR